MNLSIEIEKYCEYQNAVTLQNIKEKEMYFKWTPMYNKELIQKRAGNAKSVIFPCETVPKGIQGLQDCEPYTGHDSFLGMAYGIIDCVISKRLRCLLLLKYGKYMSVSSSSLMHKPEIASVDNIDELPANFAYGISFSCSLRLIKLIVAEWQEEEESEIAEFISNLRKILTDEFITIPDSITPCCVGNIHSYAFSKRIKGYFYNELNIVKLNGALNLIILEQLLRYTKEILWIDVDCIIQNIYSVNTIGEKQIYFHLIVSVEQVKTIIRQRKNHKRPEWSEICDILQRYIK